MHVIQTSGDRCSGQKTPSTLSCIDELQILNGIELGLHCRYHARCGKGEALHPQVVLLARARSSAMAPFFYLPHVIFVAERGLERATNNIRRPRQKGVVTASSSSSCSASPA